MQSSLSSSLKTTIPAWRTITLLLLISHTFSSIKTVDSFVISNHNVNKRIVIGDSGASIGTTERSESSERRGCSIDTLGMNNRPSGMALSAVPQKPKGCAAVPYQKQKVAVLGTGGYLGTLIFGFLQRASSIYGTGLSGAATSTPRAIVATATGSGAMNRMLSSHFYLAFAGEEFVRLTDFGGVSSSSSYSSSSTTTTPTDESAPAVARCLDGMDAVVLATVCDLERRRVTGNTYERTPNDETVEFYMDECYLASPTDDIDTDIEQHLRIFRNGLWGAKEAGVKHVVVVETPRTRLMGWERRFAEVLDEVGVPFTYVRSSGTDDGVEQWSKTKSFTFKNGVQSQLRVEGFALTEGYRDRSGYDKGDWMDSFSDEEDSSRSNVVYREDVAALVVQCLMSLDWEKSRCLSVTSQGDLDDGSDLGDMALSPSRLDREWCCRSEVLAEILGSID